MEESGSSPKNLAVAPSVKSIKVLPSILEVNEMNIGSNMKTGEDCAIKLVRISINREINDIVIVDFQSFLNKQNSSYF